MNTFNIFLFAFLCSLTPMIVIFGAIPAYFDAPAPVTMVKPGRVYSVWFCMVCAIAVLFSFIAATM